MPLSPRQREILELQKAGLTKAQIAERLGVSRNFVNNCLIEARRRLREEAGEPAPVPAEVKEARVERRIRKGRQQSEISPEARSRIDALALKLRVREVRTQDLLALVGSRAQAILETISPEDILVASLKDKVISAAILIEKRQLLSGEPTQILTVNERLHLDELVRLALAEAAKRGMTVDLSPISSEPGTPWVETTGRDPGEERRQHWRERKGVALLEEAQGR